MSSAVVIRRKNKPIMMEIVGKEGLKVAEYVDKGNKRNVPAYQQIMERMSI
jgi:hypothetical protein